MSRLPSAQSFAINDDDNFSIDQGDQNQFNWGSGPFQINERDSSMTTVNEPSHSGSNGSIRSSNINVYEQGDGLETMEPQFDTESVQLEVSSGARNSVANDRSFLNVQGNRNPFNRDGRSFSTGGRDSPMTMDNEPPHPISRRMMNEGLNRTMTAGQGAGAIVTIGSTSYPIHSGLHSALFEQGRGIYGEPSLHLFGRGEEGAGAEAPMSAAFATALNQEYEPLEPSILIPESATVDTSSTVKRPTSLGATVQILDPAELCDTSYFAHNSKSAPETTGAPPQPSIAGASTPRSSVSEGSKNITYVLANNPLPSFNDESLSSHGESKILTHPLELVQKQHIPGSVLPNQSPGESSGAGAQDARDCATKSFQTISEKDAASIAHGPSRGIDSPLSPTRIPGQLTTLFTTIAREASFIPPLELPLLYHARVNDVIENSGLTIGEIHGLSAGDALSYPKPANFQSETIQNSGSGSNRGRNTSPEEKFVMLTEAWHGMVDDLTSEWNTLNIVSAVLIPAGLTLFQIDNAKDDHITRGFTFLALVFALCSLLYGCRLIILFKRMRSQTALANFALETRRRASPTWVALALPAIWLACSILLFVTAIFCFMWRSRAPALDFVPTSPRSTELVFRIVIGVVAGINGVLYLFAAFRLDNLTRPQPVPRWALQ